MRALRLKRRLEKVGKHARPLKESRSGDRTDDVDVLGKSGAHSALNAFLLRRAWRETGVPAFPKRCLIVSFGRLSEKRGGRETEDIKNAPDARRFRVAALRA